MLPSNSYFYARRKIKLFYNILMDLTDSIMLILLFVLFYETHRYVFL